MRTSMNRSLAKVFGPALLLTATLALPVESFGAPSPEPKAAAMDKDDKRNRPQRNANKAQRQENRRQVQSQRQENRRQVQAQRQENRRQVKQQVQPNRRQEGRRQVAQYQAQRRAEQQAIQKQAQLQRQAERNRQLQLQRQAEHNRQLQLQRQAEWRRQEEARRLAEVQRRNNRNDNNNRYYPGDRYAGNRRWYNNQYDQYYRSGERFHIDGFVVEEGDGYCSLLRDHRGHVFALVGNIGDIVQGDHLRLQGRVVGGEACDWRGTAFEVIQVKTLWDNNRHESAAYDYQRDRYSFEEFLDSRY